MVLLNYDMNFKRHGGLAAGTALQCDGVAIPNRHRRATDFNAIERCGVRHLRITDNRPVPIRDLNGELIRFIGEVRLRRSPHQRLLVHTECRSRYELPPVAMQDKSRGLRF